MGTKAWQLGSPGTLLYRFYDRLREGLNHRLVHFLIGNAIGRDNCNVLEAGSGPAFASSILRTQSRIRLSIAVDIDMEALLEAQRRDRALALVLADVQALPFRSETIDLCWNSSTLEHLDAPERALHEMKRVARPGGMIFVGVPNSYGPLGFQRWVADTAVGIWIGKTFNSTQLMGMLSKIGLMPVHCIFYFFRFFVGVLAQKAS